MGVPQMEIVRNAAQRFGVAKEQKPPGASDAAMRRDRRAHLLRREIHQDVAAEDHVIGRRRPESRIVARKVSGAELHRFAHRVGETSSRRSARNHLRRTSGGASRSAHGE